MSREQPSLQARNVCVRSLLRLQVWPPCAVRPAWCGAALRCASCLAPLSLSLCTQRACATRRRLYQENGPREGSGGISRPGAVGRDRGRGNCAQALLSERYILGGTNSQNPKLISGLHTLTLDNLYQLVVHSLVPGSSAEQSRMIQVFPSSASAPANNKI